MDTVDAGERARSQVGALPYRVTPDGSIEIMLITSRETRRWVIPKGWPMRGKKPFNAAAREAFEEAGVEGEVARRAIGTYTYLKLLKSRALVPCRVSVFPLDVRRQAKRWPEQKERELRWMSPEEAASLVREEELATLIRTLPDFLKVAERGGEASKK